MSQGYQLPHWYANGVNHSPFTIHHWHANGEPFKEVGMRIGLVHRHAGGPIGTALAHWPCANGLNRYSKSDGQGGNWHASGTIDKFRRNIHVIYYTIIRIHDAILLFTFLFISRRPPAVGGRRPSAALSLVVRSSPLHPGLALPSTMCSGVLSMLYVERER